MRMLFPFSVTIKKRRLTMPHKRKKSACAMWTVTVGKEYYIIFGYKVILVNGLLTNAYVFFFFATFVSAYIKQLMHVLSWRFFK